MSDPSQPVFRPGFECEVDSFARMWRSCGKCPTCRRKKSWDWTRRAIWESAHAPKTIMFTLTFRPRGKHWKPTWAECYGDAQKWMKRLRDHVQRKDPTGPRLRYLCSAELGERNGRFHLHVLVHGGNSLTGRLGRSLWKQGVTNARIAEGSNRRRLARYVAKYATKGVGVGRVRASNGYGSRAARALNEQWLEEALQNELVAKVFEQFPDAKITAIRPRGDLAFVAGGNPRLVRNAIRASYNEHGSVPSVPRTGTNYDSALAARFGR